MRINSGKMDTATRKSHHPGWLRIFRAHRIVEVWLGDRWIFIEVSR